MPAKKKNRSTARKRAARPKKIEVISSDICRSRTLGKGCTWVIGGEVRVRTGVALTIADGATLLIANGVVRKSRIRRAAIIFDPGSQLKARRFTIKACNGSHTPVKHADNGGVWFLGNYASGSKDGISLRKVAGRVPSKFRAQSITLLHLGRHDSYSSQSKVTGRNLNIGDDIDGLSLIGVGPDEWKISNVRSLHSADDGIDLTNSRIRLDRLEVRHPCEDGMNISSSRIEIRRSLVLDVPKSRTKDRDLFDLETDNGASYVELPRGCWVRVRGVFGDQVTLSSTDMPRPTVTQDNERSYRYSGRLRADALVHSISDASGVLE